ncbi:MAG: phosphohydrolase [Acidimicrobiales bacterium]
MTAIEGRPTFKTFADSTAEDWAKIIPCLDDTQAKVADHVIGLLRSLGDDQGGFPVDRLEHSLQTATRAERDGRDEEYIVCALLHDIGDTLAPFNHPDIAAAIVKTRVSEANHFMVAKHGIFQGYYFWDYIGLDGSAREQFRDSPYFDYTEEFCAKYDQTAFDSDYKSEPLEHYEPLLRHFFSKAWTPNKS